MNQPIAIERAQVGRVMYFPALDWNAVVYSPVEDATHPRPNTQANNGVFSRQMTTGCEKAVMLENSRGPSQLLLQTPKRRRLHLKFELASTGPETEGVIFALPISMNRRREKAIVTLWQEASYTFKLEVIDSRTGQVRSSAKSQLSRSAGIANAWTEVELHIDQGQALLSLNGGGHEHGSVTLPHRARVVGPIHFGGIPQESKSTKLKNGRRPRFDGCLRHLRLNGFLQDLWNLPSSKNLLPCTIMCT